MSSRKGATSQHPTHSPERVSTLSLLLETLFLVIEVRVIDATRSRDQEIDIARYLDRSTICGSGIFVAQLGHVSE